MSKGYLAYILAFFLYANNSFGASLAEQLVEMSDNEHHSELSSKKASTNHISITPSLLEDNAGLKYIGGVVETKLVKTYLVEMKTILGGEFNNFRQAQIKRDHGKFHITLINPFELKEVDATLVKHILSAKQAIQFKAHGLGQVKNQQGQAFFVVAQSPNAQAMRAKLGLSKKDFHVTLGFLPKDIHGVAKDRTTLID